MKKKKIDKELHDVTGVIKLVARHKYDSLLAKTEYLKLLHRISPEWVDSKLKFKSLLCVMTKDVKPGCDTLFFPA